ncbi:MAG: SMI1/KNR4 family protein [Kofleriaceae bacterium]
MTSATIDLIDRVSRRLTDDDAVHARGAPATDDEIAAAEAALGCRFPPSYRAFLREVGGLSIPTHLGVVHHFVGLHHGGEPAKAVPGVVEQTLLARGEGRLAPHLVVVGMGAGYREWFCLDTARGDEGGEHPVRLFDARDNALDGDFYADFGTMVDEVLGFVEETLATPRD